MKHLTQLFILFILIYGVMISVSGAVPVIVGFKDKADVELVKQHGVIKYNYKHIPAIAADIPEVAIEKMSKNSKIAYIEPDYEVKLLDDEICWGVDRIDAEKVHSSNKGTGVKVAVIDTGIDYTHSELNDNYCGGYDFVNGDNDPMDDNWHGTHCAGIIAAEDNGVGILGVAPEVNLYSLKAFDSGGSCSLSNVIAAIDWAIDNHIQIVSMSFGMNYNSSSLEAACNRAYDSGILLVAAAGNDGNLNGTGDCVDYPANYKSVIAVTSITSSDLRSSFSSTGPAAELAAPGSFIKSTYPGGGYTLASGTSMACPHVAGSAALVWAVNPDWNNTQVRARLQETAEDLGATGRDTWYGFGLVDAEAAAGAVIPDNTAPIISEVSSEPSTCSAKITWTTNEKSDSLVKFGTEAGNLNSTVYDAAMVLSHSVIFEGLSAGTTYYYEIQSKDFAGNVNKSFNTFTTLPDTKAPSIFNINAEANASSATISWSTDEVSDTCVRYSVNHNFSGAVQKYNASRTNTHVIKLTGLTPETTYYYEVQSADLANNSAIYNNNGTYYRFTTTAEAQANEMHIGNISMSIQKSGINTRALATVSILNVTGFPVEGVTVYGSWSDITKSGDSSGITGSDGKVTFASGWVKKVKQGTFTFTVDNVKKEGWTYNLSDTAPSASITVS